MITYLITFRITTVDGSSDCYQQRRKEFDDLLAPYDPNNFPLGIENNSSTSTYIIHEDDSDLGEISVKCDAGIPNLIDCVKEFFEKDQSKYKDSFIFLKMDSSDKVLYSMRMDEGGYINGGPGVDCLN